jgi:hypothetical protein
MAASDGWVSVRKSKTGMAGSNGAVSWRFT